MSDSSASSTLRGRNESSFANPGPPLLEGPEGIRYDFNYGCRVQVPVSGWRVRMSNIDTFNLLFDEIVEANEIVTSMRKYFIRFHLEVFDGARLVFSHKFDATNKKVVVRKAALALGDSLAWIPVIDAFREQENCQLYMPLAPHLQPLYRDGYPLLNIATEAELDARTDIYATYYIGQMKPYTERDHQPTDPRVSNMQDAMAYMLGVPCEERRPNIVLEDDTRVIAEPYVCIATQATAQCKYWNNPNGWPVLIDYLKSRGYRVLCIDRDKQYGTGQHMNRMPEGAEDFTGNRPLQERASLLKHADFFVGLGSGLSWLAWAVGVPVVMISGFSHPSTEFHTPYRVINFHACNSCFNDCAETFERQNFAWCPRRVGKPQQFQCTAVITPEFVMRIVDNLIRDHALA
jgi:autotransporter strand-loop-strand O-heptosyltransferase